MSLSSDHRNRLFYLLFIISVDCATLIWISQSIVQLPCKYFNRLCYFLSNLYAEYLISIRVSQSFILLPFYYLNGLLHVHLNIQIEYYTSIQISQYIIWCSSETQTSSMSLSSDHRNRWFYLHFMISVDCDIIIWISQSIMLPPCKYLNRLCYFLSDL